MPHSSSTAHSTYPATAPASRLSVPAKRCRSMRSRPGARWPDFALQAAEHGIQSALSLPLRVSGQTLGALNLYSESLAPFTEQGVGLARIFAQQAGVALANAELFWQTHALTQNLEAALETRDRIGQAKGILIATHKITADDAFELVRRRLAAAQRQSPRRRRSRRAHRRSSPTTRISDEPRYPRCSAGRMTSCRVPSARHDQIGVPR